MEKESCYGADIGEYPNGWRTQKKYGADLSGTWNEYDNGNYYICKENDKTLRSYQYTKRISS